MKKIIFLGMLFCSFASLAQTDPQKMIDEFFNRYKSKNPNDAIDYIFSTNKWMADTQDQIDNIKFKLNGTLKLLGEYKGFNPITKKTIGEHLSFHTFLVRYDRQPLRFNFLFYKASDQWAMYSFSYDDNLDEELKEAARAYKLKENLEQH
ncbi:hypothetical protein WSM22_03640 [Cytophagales bacterium WSM2-2]|nr:hypothetical protein WSM22_03640 [Cytophagales bacterium WSM2-2]